MQPKERPRLASRIWYANTEAIKRGQGKIRGLFVFTDRLQPRRNTTSNPPPRAALGLRGLDAFGFRNFLSVRSSERLSARGKGEYNRPSRSRAILAPDTADVIRAIFSPSTRTDIATALLISACHGARY